MGLDTASVLEKVCHKIISVYNMEMREITRFYRQVKTAVYEPTHGSEKWDFSYANGNGKKLMLLYIVPIVVGLKIVNVSLWGEFINGKNVKPLMEVYKDSEVGEWLSERLLNRDETYEVVEGVKLVTVEQKIQELYCGLPSSKVLRSSQEKEIRNYEVLLNCLEAGKESYEERKRDYEILDD